MRRMTTVFTHLATAATAVLGTLAATGQFSDTLKLSIAPSPPVTQALNTIGRNGKPLLSKQDLAATCAMTIGVEAQARILSHSADQFFSLPQPVTPR